MLCYVNALLTKHTYAMLMSRWGYHVVIVRRLRPAVPQSHVAELQVGRTQVGSGPK